MPFVTEVFQAFLSGILAADDVHIPLAQPAYADLLKLLTSQKDAYTYLTLKDDTHAETVKAYAEGGYILLDRGLRSTTPTKFPFGTCVSTISPTTAAVLYDAMCDCSSTCGYDPDAMGSQLCVEIENMPQGKVGTTYNGYIILGGVLPITATFDNVPDWMTIRQVGNMIDFTGKPTESKTTVMEMEVSNLRETHVLHHTVTITVANA